MYKLDKDGNMISKAYPGFSSKFLSINYRFSPFLPDRDTLTRGREDTMGRSTTTINTSIDEITVLACETLASSDISDEPYSCDQGRRRVRVRKKHFQRFGLWFLSKLFL